MTEISSRNHQLSKFNFGVDTMKLNKWFSEVAETVSHAAGHAVSFIICCGVILAWAASGPLFKFSDTWQLVINTGTTIVTFLMVFLIQNTQNRDGAAIQAKLDELIRVTAAFQLFYRNRASHRGRSELI
jgi:low affinity Fe/Cu permease